MKFSIQTASCPDDTYFVVADVLPSFEGDVLTIVDGYGTRRSWGAPSVRSTVTQLTDTVICVDVVGWHKHTVSPVGGSYYFVCSPKTGWERKRGNAKAVKAALTEHQSSKVAVAA
jgi:hypothetical protein